MSDKWPEFPTNNRVYLGVGVVFMIIWLSMRAYGIYPLLNSNPERPRLTGADSYFHLRHAEAVLNDFPNIMRYDTLAAYPHRDRGINQGFYDILIAAISKASFGLITPIGLLTWMAALLTGLSGLLIAYWLARKESPSLAALFLLLLLAFPGPLSQVACVGNGDHHGWEIFLQTLLMLSLTWTLKPNVSLQYMVAPVVLINLFYLSWAGSPLHLFFVGICFFVWAFVEHPPETRKLLSLKGVVMGLSLAGFPKFIELAIPTLMMWKAATDAFVVGGLALAFGYPVLIWLAQKIPSRVRGWVTPLALVVSLSSLKLSPELWNAFLMFLSPRSTGISEQITVTPRLLFSYYGLTTLGLLLGPLLLVRDKKMREYCIPLTYSVGLALFWVYTRDFNYYTPYATAATSAYCLYRLPWRNWTPAVIIAVSTICLFPIPGQTRPWITPALARDLMLNKQAFADAGHFLDQVKEKTGAEYGLLAPWDLGNILTYTTRTGVAVSQTHSAYLARIFYAPTMDQVFKQMRNRNLRFFFIPARNLEEKLGTDMLLADRNPSEIMDKGKDIEWNGQTFTLPKYNQNYRNLPIVQLFDGMAKNLGRFRLVYESPQKVVRTVQLGDDLKSFSFIALDVTDEESKALKSVLRTRDTVTPTSRGLLVNSSLSPDVRIFERVRGAVLTGQTNTPHGPVGAYLSISSPYAEAPYIITWQLLADNFGFFELRLPYPTDRALYDVEGSIRVNGEYRVECNGRVYKVSLTEEQVQRGRKIPLDNFPVIRDTNKESEQKK